jgi:autotransporter-associated beta strand protein
MKVNRSYNFIAIAAAITCAGVCYLPAQTLTNPVPNRVVSWNLDDWSTINPTDLAGLAPATNWVDTFLNDITIGLPDNQGTTTTLNLGRSSFNTWHIQANHPGYDANGTANRELLNGYLNAGPAAWNPPVTNTFVSLTNIPYSRYDVVVYFNSDTSGRHASIDNGASTYYFSTVGSAARSGANALFLPTTETNSAVFPSADFAFFPGMTAANAVFTETPKSGNDQWLGIAAFQVIESSNVYVLYGPAPSAQTLSFGVPASFKVMAGGLNPTYQWRHAGTNLLNATNATYSIASTAPGHEGNYDVIIANGFSSVTSAVATLTLYSGKSLEWAGNSSIWDTTTAAWTTNGGISTTLYVDTDNVLFSPLGAAQGNVSLAGTFAPSSITVSNSSYVLAGGGVMGSGGLRVRNNGTLILDTVDTRTGPTLIDAGSTFQLDNNDTAGSLGSGLLTNNGALIFNAAGDEAYGYPVYGTGSITNISSVGTITLGNNVRASYLSQAGTGILLLQGSNTLTGGLVVSGGTVWARAADCLGLAPVVVSGGELQLVFGIDFTASTVTLSGGFLHAGVGGSPTLEGQVLLAADSTIQVDGANILTLPNPAGFNGGAFNFTKSGSGTLILGGTNNTWASATITGTLQIGNGGPAKIGGGIISDSGALAINSSSVLTITNPITGGGEIDQLGTGTTILTADNNVAGFFGMLNVSNGTLLVNGTSGSGAVTVAGGTLGGTGIIDGPVSILADAFLAPGSSVGTLTINSDLAIGGNLIIEVNKSVSPSNDAVTVTGALSHLGSGIVTVQNLGPALTAGDKFKLFNQAVVGGETFPVSGAGAVWTNKLAVDGSIEVLSATVSHPVINNVVIAGGTNLVFSGTNGSAGGSYHIVSSTNLASPFAGWTVESAGTFSGSGAFSVTNSMTPGTPQKFYLLKLP